MNNQPIQKQFLTSNGFLFVHSIFQTFQGEGPFVGEPAVFIRLTGCNLQCPYCDTEYTANSTELYADDIVSIVNAQKTPNKLVVITGGEPFRQNIAPLVYRLLDSGFRVQVETNGTLYLPSLECIYDEITIVCSPKASKVNKKLEPHIDAYKYVISSTSVSMDDGLPEKVLDHSCKDAVARPPKDFDGNIYVQPMDAGDDLLNSLNLEAAMRVCLFNGYILCLQLQKILNVE